ncbi:hypothetical protein IAT38_004886 [Cryptococcus sp. DSM 104549]
MPPPNTHRRTSTSSASTLSTSPPSRTHQGDRYPTTYPSHHPSHSGAPTASTATSEVQTNGGPSARQYDNSRIGRWSASKEELGLSSWIACTADEDAIFTFCSESMQEILGYAPKELVGKSLYLIFHPEEIPVLRQIHYQALTEERTACVAYFRVLHRDGYYVECCCSYSTVFNMTLALYTRAVDGQRTLQQALTAREVMEVSPASQGRFAIKRWPASASLTSPPISTHLFPVSPPVDSRPWPVVPNPTPRTFYILDRFTDTSRVTYVSNDVIIKASSLRGHPFYSIIKPSDRSHVRKYIEAAKASTPVMYDSQRSGGHGYTNFHVLKIPDLPPAGEAWPQGTDESERSMPGQEFILVEGIFTANSDGLSCIISKLPLPERKASSGGPGVGVAERKPSSGGSPGVGSAGAKPVSNGLSGPSGAASVAAGVPEKEEGRTSGVTKAKEPEEERKGGIPIRKLTN